MSATATRHRTTLLADLLDEDGRVDAAAWRAAHERRSPVALCGCGAVAVTMPGAGPWENHFGVRWYACACTGCGHETEWTAGRQFIRAARSSAVLLSAHAEVERRRLADV